MDSSQLTVVASGSGQSGQNAGNPRALGPTQNRPAFSFVVLVAGLLLCVAHDCFTAKKRPNSQCSQLEGAAIGTRLWTSTALDFWVLGGYTAATGWLLQQSAKECHLCLSWSHF